MPATLSDSCRQQIDSLIRRKAKSILGQAGIRSQDLPDVQQMLWVRILSRIPSLQDRGELDQYHPLIERILDQGLSNLLRDRRAQKRSGSRTVLFSVFPFPIEHLFPDRQGTRRYQLPADLDWQTAWDSLDPQVQSILLRLPNSHRYGLRKALGLTRTQFRQFIHQLQTHFLRFGYSFGVISYDCI